MRRDDGEFGAFVAGSSHRLVGTAYLLTGDRGLAEDLLQDAYERLYVAWPRVNDPEAYVRTVLSRLAVSRWRTRSRRPKESAWFSSEHEPAELIRRDDSAVDHADRDVLITALRSLPPGQRAVIVLRYFADLTEAATADAMGCSVGTVKSQTSRALARLRDVLPTLDESFPAPEGVRS